MTREEVKTVVVQVIQDLLDADRLPSRPIDETTNPISNLGLKSLAGVDAAWEISRRLRIHIEPESNPFVDDEKRRSRSVGEIVDYLMARNK